MSTKSELRAEIERLAKVVQEYREASDARDRDNERKFKEFAKSVTGAAGEKVTLILPDGTIVAALVADVSWSRMPQDGLLDVSMVVYPQPPSME